MPHGRTEYPPPPWRLRHMALGPISFWEVAPEMFVGADDFVEATNAFIDGTVKPVSYAKLKEGYDLVEDKGLAPLRDFGAEDFEVVHGWLVYDVNGREAAEKAVERAGGVGRYGRPLAQHWADVKATGISPNPAGAKKAESAGESPSSLTRYKSARGDLYWEVLPGRIITASSEKEALSRFEKNGVAITSSLKFGIEHWGVVIDSDEPEAAPEPLRRFRDKEGDQWFLLPEERKLYCGTEEDMARKHPQDGDNIDHAFVWGPFEEIDGDNNVIAEYETAEELIAEIDGEGPFPGAIVDEIISLTPEAKEAPAMPASTRTPPSFMAYLEDDYGRPWFEVSADRWVCTEEDSMTLPQKAGDAWKRFAKKGYEESGYGRSRNTIERDFRPLTDKGFTEVEVKESLTQSELLGKVISGDKCRCAKLEGQDELDKRVRVQGNTFCVDCGKLRP